MEKNEIVSMCFVDQIREDYLYALTSRTFCNMHEPPLNSRLRISTKLCQDLKHPSKRRR